MKVLYGTGTACVVEFEAYCESPADWPLVCSSSEAAKPTERG
jgi:hypothetical protein